MNTIVFGEPKIYIVKAGVCKRIYRDGESREIYEKKYIVMGKSPYRLINGQQKLSPALAIMLH